MKISVILAFLLSWSFVSSNPHKETSNDKSVGELNYENDGGSDSLNLARTSSDDASSGKDWGGDTSSFLSQTDPDRTDDANHRSFLLTLISEGSKMGAKFVHKIVEGIKRMTGTSILKDESPDIPLNGEDLPNDNENILARIQENIKTLDQVNQHYEMEKSVNEETKKHDNRAKRSISEHLLKLSEGSPSNVLRSEKATIAEALNGRAAIRKILERARANAAKAMQHKDLYDSDDFGKWLLSGSSFDTNIFHHPHHRPSLDAEVEEHFDTENTDDLRHRTFSAPNYVFDPTNRPHYDHNLHHDRRHYKGKRTFDTLSDSTATDTADTEHSYAELLHKSKHRERLSPKLQITSGEERSHDEEDGVFRKSTMVSHRAHQPLSYEDDTADDTGLQYYSHAYAPHMRSRVTEAEDTGNGMPRWEHAKWIHRFGARAPHLADSLEFDSSEEVDDYKKRYIFKTTFEGFGDEEADNEEARAGHREGNWISSEADIYDRIHYDSPGDEEVKLTTSDSHGRTNWADVLGRERYHYGVGDQERFVYDGEADAVASDGAKNRHLADFLVERASSVNSRREENIRNKNEHLEHDGAERSVIYSRTPAGTTGAATGERSGNVLTTKISTGTPAWKAANIDIEHYHSGDRNAAANTATSLPPGLSDEKGSERTTNALTSVDDGSATARREAAKSASRAILRKTQPVIDNDATATEIEMGFSGIKSHPWAGVRWAHSSLPREHSKTHLGNQAAHRGISGHGRAAADAIASAETEQSMDSGGEDAPLGRMEMRENLPAGEYENYADYDRGENEEVNGGAESSAEATSSVGSERRYDLLRIASSSDDSRDSDDHAGIRKEYVELNGGRRTTGRHGTLAEMIDLPDRSDETYIITPEFPVYKFRKGHWPYDVDYRDFDSEEMRDDQEIEIAESAGDSGESAIIYDDWQEKEKFSADDETSKQSVMAISNARGSNGRRDRYGEHSERIQRNWYDRHAFNQFLRNMTWSSSFMNISEYEAWERYIMYLYYLWEQENGQSDASLEASTLATEENEKQDHAIGVETSLDRHGRKHTADEDNYIHLKKHKKWPERAGKLIIKNAPDLKSDEIKLINNRRTSNEDYGEGETMSEENVNNQREDREVLTRTRNVIRKGSTADSMLTAYSDKRIIDNNNYHQQDSWNSPSLEDFYADAQTKTDGYDSHKRNKNIDIKQAAKTTESVDSEDNLRLVSTETSSTSQSYAESQLDEHIINKSNDMEKVVTQASSEEKLTPELILEENRYQDEADSRDASMTSSESSDKSQIKGMRYLKEKSRTDKKNSANTETLIEMASSSSTTDKSQSNVQDTMAASILSAESQNGSEHYLEDLEDVSKHSVNTDASTNAISMKDRRGSVPENESSMQSKMEMENYSNENMKNTQISTINPGASSSELFTKSKIETGQTRNDFKNVEMNTNEKASSTVMLSNNEWSTLSERLSAESRLKSNYYLTNRKKSQINAASRLSADSTSSDTAEDEHRSHLRRSFSSSSSASSGKLKTDSQYDSNSIQSSQTNAATAQSSAISTSLSNAESGYWIDSSKSSSSNSWEEARQHNSNNVIKIQDNNMENRSDLESASSSKSQVRMPKLKDKHYLSVTGDNENNVVNIDTLSKTKSSTTIEDDHYQKAVSLSLASYSSAESEVENRSGRRETMISSTINDTEQLNLQRMLSSSQTASKDDSKIQAKWLFGSKNNFKPITNNKVIEKGETARENSDTATSVTAVASADIRNTKSSITSSDDSKAETKIYSENQLKENEAITENSAILKIPTTSRTSSEIGDNDKNRLLKTSTSSESHSTSAEEKRRDMDTMQNSKESMTVAETSLESTVSNNNVRSRNESTLLAFSEEARNLNVRREKSEDSVSEATLMTSNNDNNEYLTNSSVIPSKKSQTEDKLRDKNGTIAKDSIEMSKSAVIRSNEYERLKHISPYDYRGRERMESEINSRGSVKYPKHTSDINEISTGSTASTVSNYADRNNLLKVTSDDLHAGPLQEDENKSDIHSGADRTANTGTISYDDKQVRGNILRKLIFLGNPSDETQMTQKSNYDAPRKLPTINGDKEFKKNHLWERLSNGLQVKNGKVESIASTSGNVNDAIDLSTSTDTVNIHFRGDRQDNPNAISIANIRDETIESSVDTQAQSKINRKSSVPTENEIIDIKTRDIYNINKWLTKYQTSYAKAQDKFENSLKTKVSTESIINKIDENSHEAGAIREKSSSISSDPHNYGVRQTANEKDAAKVKASAETSISNVSPVECQDDARKEASAISQLKRHDLNVQDGDKITSDVLQSAEEAKFNGMQNTQQRKSSGSVTSSNSRTEVQHEEISDIAKEGLEVIASAATSAQTASSETVESESREKLIGVSSKSDSYAKSQRGSRRNLNMASRREQIIAKASADSTVSNNLKSVRQSDRTKKDSLADLSRNTYAKIENKNLAGSNFVNIANSTSSTKETSYGVIKDEHQSGVTTTALLSNSRAEAQKQHDYNSSFQPESIETSSSDTKERFLNAENIVNNVEANLKAGAIFSSDVQDSSLLSANSNAESRVDNIRAQMMTSNEFEDIKVDEPLEKTSSSDASANAPAIDENNIEEGSSKNDDNILRKDLRNSGNAETSGQATSFGDVEYDLQKGDERESRILQKQRLISVNSTASSTSETFDYADSMRENNEELTKELSAMSSSNFYKKSDVGNESRVNVLAKDYADDLGMSTQTMIPDEFGGIEVDKSLKMTSSSAASANAQATDENSTEEDSSAVVNAGTETATSANTKGMDLYGLFDSLNAAENSQETRNAEMSAMSLVSASIDARAKHADNFMREKSNVDAPIRELTKTENDDNLLQKDLRNSGNTEILGQAASFSDVKYNLQERDERESRILQKQHSISVDSTASSFSKTSNHADSTQENNLEELTAMLSSSSYEKSDVGSENRVNVLAEDYAGVFDASTSTQMMTSAEIEDMKVNKSFETTSLSDVSANTQPSFQEESTKTFSSDTDRVPNTENMMEANLKAGIIFSSGVQGSSVESRADNTHTQTTASDEFGDIEVDESLETASSSDAVANAQATDGNSTGEDSSAVANARTETSTSTDLHALSDLLTGAARRMRIEGEAISREGAIKEDLSVTSSDVFSGTGVESARILDSKFENSANVNAIAKTRSGDRRDQQGDSRGTVSSSSGIRDSQLDVMKSTSSADPYTAARITSEGIAEKGDSGVNISTLGAAETHSQVEEAQPSDWLVTTSDAGAKGRAQNKDEFSAVREVEEVAGNIEGEQHDTRAEESDEWQCDSKVATKIRHAATASSASAATIASTEAESKSEGQSVSNNKMMILSSNEANAEARVRTEGESSVLRNTEDSVNIEETRSLTTSAASTVSGSTFDNLDVNHRARYHQIDDGVSATASASKGTHLSSGETTDLYPSREISECDDNVETREFISEATSLYQMLKKQRGSEILLMKKNPKGLVQIASLKNNVPPLIAYRLIPREVYERIRTIIASKQIFCANCALSSI